jgi:hypothetical protein
MSSWITIENIMDWILVGCGTHTFIYTFNIHFRDYSSFPSVFCIGLNSKQLNHFPNVFIYPDSGCTSFPVMPFTSRTWVTKARRDEGTTESCSIATLMKYTLLFINSFYKERVWSEKACQVLHIKVTLAQGSTVKINSLLCLLYFFSFIIHMCIQGLGHFYPLHPPLPHTPLPPSNPQLLNTQQKLFCPYF